MTEIINSRSAFFSKKKKSKKKLKPTEQTIDLTQFQNIGNIIEMAF